MKKDGKFLLVMLLFEEEIYVDHAADQVEGTQDNSKEKMPQEWYSTHAPHGSKLLFSSAWFD